MIFTTKFYFLYFIVQNYYENYTENNLSFIFLVSYTGKMSDTYSTSDASDDSGVSNNRRLRNRRHNATTILEQIVVCQNCRSVIFPWRTYVRIEGVLVWFTIDATTLIYVEENWRCRRCQVVLSGGVPWNDIVCAFERNLCILSLQDIIVVSASFNIIN